MQSCFPWLAIALLLATPAAANDIETLHGRLRQRLLRDGPPDTGRVKQILERQTGEGAWPGVDYDDPSRKGWDGTRHLEKTLTLAKAHESSKGEYHDAPAVREAIVAAMRYWTDHDYESPNWWHNVIGAPRILGRVMVLIGDELPGNVREQSLKRLGQTEIGRTGQNRIDQSSIVLMRAVVMDDRALVKRARRNILKPVTITDAEGLQRDYSFHQHGPQMATWTYGAGFMRATVKWWALFEGTDFALSKRQRELIRRYMLRGVRWSAWRGHMDISVRGRSICRGPLDGKDDRLKSVLEQLIDIDPVAREAYQKTLAFNFGDRNRPVPRGHKHFWESEYSVRRANDWFASVRMDSTRTRRTETWVNKENRKGYHLADGAMYVLRRGDEYQNIFPVWDWHKIPGVTAKASGELPEDRKQRNRSEFVGGVSGERRGVAAMRFDKGDVAARKAWFFTKEGVLCLGAGIKSEAKTPILTTLNQCRLNGEVRVQTSNSSGPQVQSAPKTTYEKPAWVHHDGVGYIFPRKGRVTVARQAQTGTWRSIQGGASGGSKEPVTKEVFSLWLDHGEKPDAAGYAYFVLPSASAAETGRSARSPKVRMLANTADVQAARNPSRGVVQAVFYKAGELPYAEGQTIRVDQPCILMRRRNDTKTTLTVADPTQSLDAVTVTVNGRSRKVSLPSGLEAGRGQQIEWKH